MAEEQPLYFLHIPKTAGASFLTILESQFRLSQICRFWHWLQITDARPEDLRRYRLFGGHFGYSLVKHLPLKPRVLTLLRDPFQRSLSLYGHIKRVQGHPMHQKLQSQTFEEFIRDPEGRSIIDNFQTRLIADDVELPQILSYSGSNMDLTSHHQMLVDFLTHDRRSIAEQCEIAKQRLEDMAFVGITERFEEVLFVLCQQFGWRFFFEVEKRNEAGNRIGLEQITPAARSELEEILQYDLALYRHAEVLFNRCFSVTLRRLTYADEKTGCQLTCQSHIDFTFDECIPGTGWKSWREFTPDGLTPYCWSGPGTVSTLNFRVARDRDLTVTIKAWGAIGPDVLASLKLTVNDTPIELEMSWDAAHKATYRGFIPRRALQSEQPLTRLAFSVNRTVSPREAFGLDEDPPIGIALSRITLLPTGWSRDPFGLTALIARLGHSQFLRNAMESTQRKTAPGPIDPSDYVAPWYAKCFFAICPTALVPLAVRLKHGADALGKPVRKLLRK